MYRFTYNTYRMFDGEFSITAHYLHDSSMAKGIKTLGDPMVLAGYILTISGTGAEIGIPLAKAGSKISLYSDLGDKAVNAFLNSDLKADLNGVIVFLKGVGYGIINKYIPDYVGKFIPYENKMEKIAQEIVKQGTAIKLAISEWLIDSAIEKKRERDK